MSIRALFENDEENQKIFLKRKAEYDKREAEYIKKINDRKIRQGTLDKAKVKSLKMFKVPSTKVIQLVKGLDYIVKTVDDDFNILTDLTLNFLKLDKEIVYFKDKEENKISMPESEFDNNKAFAYDIRKNYNSSWI